MSGQLVKILKDNDNVAFALDQLLEGETFDNTVSTMGAFVFKDINGNAVAPQLNPEGAVVVSFDAGTTIRNSAKLLAGAQTKDAELEVAKITLTLNKTYDKISAQVANFRQSLFRLVYVDDVGVGDTETELGYALTDAGNINEKIQLVVDTFNTIGGTGVQELRVYHTPLDKENDAYASLSVNEIAS